MVINMNENKELLILIYDNAKMGISSTKKLLELIKEKDNKIKFLLEEEHQKYTDILKKCEKLMKQHKIKSEHSTVLKDLTANTAMTIEVNKDNSDAKIASLLSRGFSMGNITIEAKIKDYEKEASKETLKLAKELLAFGENQVEILKSYI